MEGAGRRTTELFSARPVSARPCCVRLLCARLFSARRVPGRHQLDPQRPTAFPLQHQGVLLVGGNPADAQPLPQTRPRIVGQHRPRIGEPLANPAEHTLPRITPGGIRRLTTLGRRQPQRVEEAVDRRPRPDLRDPDRESAARAVRPRIVAEKRRPLPADHPVDLRAPRRGQHDRRREVHQRRRLRRHRHQPGHRHLPARPRLPVVPAGRRPLLRESRAVTTAGPGRNRRPDDLGSPDDLRAAGPPGERHHRLVRPDQQHLRGRTPRQRPRQHTEPMLLRPDRNVQNMRPLIREPAAVAGHPDLDRVVQRGRVRPYGRGPALVRTRQNILVGGRHLPGQALGRMRGRSLRTGHRTTSIDGRKISTRWTQRLRSLKPGEAAA
ncbi:hypothetical protein MB27_24070 [Actinoplanes utahensis]|uniref:Uncharacterized protein n=1 Tax=Actinoplanes utahensis TaxID=1869 RepID=A0A0A6UGK3_ACTUT|nr:hypothetical protein MB27_24070 [Actinoplanes utahensis]